MRNTSRGLVISEGTSVCVAEPNARYGLEGYNEGSEYHFECCENDMGRYIRVYPNPDVDYYETVGPVIFKKFFLVTMERSVS